jgi:hypothetical protein
MPYVQRRSFNLGQQGGVTALVWPFSALMGITSGFTVPSVLLKQKQKKHFRNMQGDCVKKHARRSRNI